MSHIEDTLKRIVINSYEPLTFTIKITERDNKLSSHFYDVSALKIIKELEKSKNVVNLQKITKFVKYSDGKWTLRYTDYVPEEHPNRILLLQASNLRDDGNLNLSTGIEKYIPKELHEKWKKSQVKPGNIVIVITGVTIGVSSVIPDGFPEANLNQALALIALEKECIVNGENRKIDKEYVINYLNSVFGNIQFMRYGGYRAAQSGLSTAEIKSVFIPIFTEQIQKKIIFQTNKHRKIAYQYEQQYYEKADEFLTLFENVVQKKLPVIKKQTFVYAPKCNDDRVDCLFNSPHLKSLHCYLKELEQEGKVKLVKGKKLLAKERKINKSSFEEKKINTYRYVDLNKVNKETGEIEEFNEDILLNLPTRARQFMKLNDVLIPSPIFSKKSVAIVPKKFDGHICSTGFQIIETNSIEDAIMFFALFKSSLMQKQMLYVHSGCAQPNVSSRSFKELIIPIPQETYRKNYIQNATKILEESKSLRDRQVTEMLNAKKVFENLVTENL